MCGLSDEAWQFIQHKPAEDRDLPSVHLALLPEPSGVEVSPDQIAEYVYRSDSEPGIYYLVVVFTSEETYRRNAERPETHAGYARLLQFLDGEPEWRDGAIIHSYRA